MGVRRIAVSIMLTLALLMIGAPGGASVPPANDDFASAIDVAALPFEDTVDTTEATLEQDEPQPPCTFFTGNTVWYEFTPGADTIVSLDTLGSDFDSVLAVWTGAELSSLDLVACNDDALSLSAQVSFRARSATTYHIQVGGFDSAAGSLLFRMRTVEAGVIEGTVTREGTGAPLPGICVEALDRDLFSAQTVVTGADGTFEVVVRGGSYLVAFIDFCDPSDDHVPEWYDDVAFSEPQSATPIDLSAGDVVSGIDAELTGGCPGIASLAAVLGFNQIVGTAGPDDLVGTEDEDVLCGLGGDDTLKGLAGLDVLFGGPGRDRLLGGRGHDELIGSLGKDELVGGPGADLLLGGRGNDRLRGGTGRDLLSGGPGRDRCVGGPGADLARGCEVTRSVIRSRSRVIVRGSAGAISAREPRSLDELVAILRR
ncbi:MAG TPA: hypothetical protein VF097_12180 [Actinomycetota bacterium]